MISSLLAYLGVEALDRLGLFTVDSSEDRAIVSVLLNIT